nr:uroporphyrinogen-III synthase [Acidisoma sp. PAMC 29798]
MTRPEPGAAATAAQLVAMGYHPVVAPLLTIHAVAAELPAPDTVQAILVTSRQAIPRLPHAYAHCPLLAVGDATAGSARAHGFTQVSSADGDAKALAVLAARSLAPNGAPLLLASGVGQGHHLERLLTRRGFTVLRREVYAAQPVEALPAPARDMLASSHAGWVLLFSRETAFCFHRLVRHGDLLAGLRPLRLAAISHPVADSVRDLPWRSIHVAMTPTENAVLALIDER